MMDHAVLDNMLSSAPPKGARLNDLPSDARLPQLPIILDMEIMRERFQDCLFVSVNNRTRLVVRQCEIVQIRYKPASSCMVSYRLDIENTSTGERGEQIICGRAFPEGCSQSQWERASTRTLVQPRFGKPLIHLPEIEMVLWSFPNDRKMHTLPASVDAALGTFTIPPSWLLPHLGTGWHVTDTRSRVMHYVGEHTCTVQTAFDLIHPSQDTRQTLTIFGKTYYNVEGAQTDRVMRQLWDSEARRKGRLNMAQPLWYDARLKTLWQLGLQGTTLNSCAIEDPKSVPLLIQAAATVAALHSTSLSELRTITVPNLIEKLSTVGSLLIRHRPSCQSLLAPLLTRLTAQAPIIPANQTATLHGDLHLKNLFLTNGKIALIDLDNVCEGPPGWDIGSFTAGLLTGTLTKRSSLSQVASHLNTFLDHYNQCVAWNVDRQIVAWFTAVALVVERSHRCITRLKNDRRGHLEALLSLADRISKALSLESLADGLAETDGRSGQP